MTYQTSARNELPLSQGGAAPAAVWWAWSLLQPRPGSYPVVDVFHQPESGRLHCIALLLQLPQQVYVRRAGLMQGPSALKAPLLQLYLHGQLTLQQQSLVQMPLLCQQGNAGCTGPSKGAFDRRSFRCGAAVENSSSFPSLDTRLHGGHCVCFHTQLKLQGSLKTGQDHAYEPQIGCTKMLRMMTGPLQCEPQQACNDRRKA